MSICGLTQTVVDKPTWAKRTDLPMKSEDLLRVVGKEAAAVSTCTSPEGRPGSQHEDKSTAELITRSAAWHCLLETVVVAMAFGLATMPVALAYTSNMASWQPHMAQQS